MLSAAVGKPLAAADIFPHVEAALSHWQRGDKALANLRLVVAKLPQVTDPASLARLAIAEDLLDGGLAPTDLMKALWPQGSNILHRYNPDQPRVPAGCGIDSGRWCAEEASGRGEQDRIVVAAQPEGIKHETVEDEKDFEERNMTGLTTIEEQLAHHRPMDPFGGLPFIGVGTGPFARQLIPAGPTLKPSPAQQRTLDAAGRKDGCHTCGTTDPGTTYGNFVGDHQPPTALSPPGAVQRYFPQCLRCSSVQGGRVRALKARNQQKLQRGYQMQDSTWIMSEGGPLIIMAKNQFGDWGGVLSRKSSSSRFSNDYEEACDVTRFVSKITVGGKDAIIIGDAPFHSRFWQNSHETYIIRVMYCNEDFDESSVMKKISSTFFDSPAEEISVRLDHGEVFMFDSAEPGDDPDKEFVVQSFEGGTYRIFTQRYEPDPDTSLILHRFDRVGI